MRSKCVSGTDLELDEQGAKLETRKGKFELDFNRNAQCYVRALFLPISQQRSHAEIKSLDHYNALQEWSLHSSHLTSAQLSSACKN